MNRNEVLDLLSVAVAYDNRNPTEAQVLAWGEAAERARWTYREALDAVHTHYSRTSDFLMPGHITELVKAERNQPPHRPAVEGPPPASREHVAKMIATVGRNLDWHGPEEDPAERRSALTVKCPWCSALPGDMCTRPTGEPGSSGRAVLKRVHPSRLDAAREVPA